MVAFLLTNLNEVFAIENSGDFLSHLQTNEGSQANLRFERSTLQLTRKSKQSGLNKSENGCLKGTQLVVDHV